MCRERGQGCECPLNVCVHCMLMCVRLFLSLLCPGHWRLCLLSQCQGLLACPTSLTISRPLEKVRWALDYLANSAGEGDVSGNPSLENSGEQHPLNLSHPTQSYLGWDVAQALRHWCALCLLWSRASVQVYELCVHVLCSCK